MKVLLLFLVLLAGCSQANEKNTDDVNTPPPEVPAQDVSVSLTADRVDSLDLHDKILFPNVYPPGTFIILDEEMAVVGRTSGSVDSLYVGSMEIDTVSGNITFRLRTGGTYTYFPEAQKITFREETGRYQLVYQSGS